MYIVLVSYCAYFFFSLVLVLFSYFVLRFFFFTGNMRF